MNYGSVKTKAVYDILWDMATLEFSLTHDEFQNNIKAIMWIFFRKIGLESCKLDRNWRDMHALMAKAQYNEKRSYNEKA